VCCVCVCVCVCINVNSVLLAERLWRSVGGGEPLLDAHLVFTLAGLQCNPPPPSPSPTGTDQGLIAHHLSWEQGGTYLSGTNRGAGVRKKKKNTEPEWGAVWRGPGGLHRAPARRAHQRQRASVSAPQFK